MAGVFNNVCPKAAVRVMRKLKIGRSILECYSHYLLNRLCNITIKGVTIQEALKRGTPKGGVLSAILWLLIVTSFSTSSLSSIDGPKLS